MSDWKFSVEGGIEKSLRFSSAKIQKADKSVLKWYIFLFSDADFISIIRFSI